MTTRDRRGRFVSAERTTETRETRVTERFTIHDTAPINAIPGWGPGPGLLEQRQQHRTHLETQQARCLDFLWDVVVSGEMTAESTGSWEVFRHQLPELIDRAVTILTSGPKATPLELTTGRSV